MRSIGALRRRGDVLVADAGDAVWLRGDHLDEGLELELRKLPGARRYRLDDGDQLTPVGSRLPAEALPGVTPWTPVSSWLSPRPQPAALPGVLPHRAALRVQRRDTERPATVLLATVNAFVEYAATAPAVRLNRLRLAASADDRAVVRGEPLPPIAGGRYYEELGIAFPCGYGSCPPIGPAVVRQLLALSEGDLALFHPDGSYERIDAANFARATRGAARATRDAFKAEAV